MKWVAIPMALAVGLAGATVGHAADTLGAVKARGVLNCGTDNSAPGFGYQNPKSGKLEGLDVDLCRAVAAGVLGDPEKINFVITTDKSRFDILTTGQTDIVFAHTTIIPARESAIGIDFVPVTYYDGSGFMVKTESGVKSAKELDGAALCTVQGSGTEISLASFIAAQKFSADTKSLTFQDLRSLFDALSSGRCDAMFTDKSAEAAWRSNAPNPAEFSILPETLDKSPQAGFVIEGDAKWRDAVSFIIYGLFQAEEYGVTSANLADMQKSDNPDIRKFLGDPGDFGKSFGLPGDFMSKVIASVGNYAEIYNRNLGPSTPFAIERKGSLNASWRDGGLLYSPPWL